MVKNLPAMQETWVLSGFCPGWEDPLETEMATHSNILAWKNPMDRRAWRATVHGATESDTTERTHAETLKQRAGFTSPSVRSSSVKCTRFVVQTVLLWRQTDARRSPDPAILLVGTYPGKRTCVVTKMWIQAFIAALSVVVNNWEQPKYPSTCDWIKLVHLFSEILLNNRKGKKPKILRHTTLWTVSAILREVRKSRRRLIHQVLSCFKELEKIQIAL